MRIRLRYLTAAGAIVALCGAPAATAEPSCSSEGGSTVCSTPGNVEINSSPSADFTLPYWDETFGDSGYYPGPYPVPYDEGSGDVGSGHSR
jgi:hypothetical protein